MIYVHAEPFPAFALIVLFTFQSLRIDTDRRVHALGVFKLDSNRFVYVSKIRSVCFFSKRIIGRLIHMLIVEYTWNWSHDIHLLYSEIRCWFSPLHKSNQNINRFIPDNVSCFCDFSVIPTLTMSQNPGPSQFGKWCILGQLQQTCYDPCDFEDPVFVPSI